MKTVSQTSLTDFLLPPLYGNAPGRRLRSRGSRHTSSYESGPALKIEEKKEEPNHRKTPPQGYVLPQAALLTQVLKNSKSPWHSNGPKTHALHVCLFLYNIHLYLHFKSTGFENTIKPKDFTESFTSMLDKLGVFIFYFPKS